MRRGGCACFSIPQSVVTMELQIACKTHLPAVCVTLPGYCIRQGAPRSAGESLQRPLRRSRLGRLLCRTWCARTSVPGRRDDPPQCIVRRRPRVRDVTAKHPAQGVVLAKAFVRPFHAPAWSDFPAWVDFPERRVPRQENASLRDKFHAHFRLSPRPCKHLDLLICRAC